MQKTRELLRLTFELGLRHRATGGPAYRSHVRGGHLELVGPWPTYAISTGPGAPAPGRVRPRHRPVEGDGSAQGGEAASAGRRTRLAATQGELHDDAAIAAVLGQARRACGTISSAEPHRAQIQRWFEPGVGEIAIHAALRRAHSYNGSYSAVRRMLQQMRASLPPDLTVPLHLAPGEAAQVDFGAGPTLFDPARNAQHRTRCFVMTLCFSRHQYVEFVFDQSVMTWLGCHRRAFEWFASVPARVIIDNPECAIPAP